MANTKHLMPRVGDPNGPHIEFVNEDGRAGIRTELGEMPLVTTDINGDTVLEVADKTIKPLLAGVITIAEISQVVPTQAITASMNGEKLLYPTAIRDDFGGAQTSLNTNPGHIYVPTGVTYARFTASVAFPAEALSAATGIRWARILQGTGTHKGNSGGRPAVADAPSVLQVVTSIVPVVAGEYYWVGGIQSSGGNLTLSPGNASNNYASNWFTAEFFH